MLKLSHISKEYKTGSFVQKALDDVSLTLRDNEFVAVLGPSGSGKTTMLNLIGGLDRYDKGDLIINSVSTKKYRDRDWDSYRNHSVGFVFQSYNLIPHQSILSNVELALTISGIRKKERRKRAKEALLRVGLGEHLHKRPNQLSGGQMQRVAIARALVNDPRILLADEPTGALDSDTSVQVMELLKEVARDRLVVMVTHNPELAETYATRIVNLKDGKITGDSDPVPEAEEAPATHKNFGRARMSFFTALSLSFNNLLTKKARTVLTSFAGSIGIIGIALILSLSTGVQNYIDDIQKETMTSYPITIDAETIDLSGIFSAGQKAVTDEGVEHELDAVYSNASGFELASVASMSLTENNLTKFKQYLDDPTSEIHEYLGENGVVYSYDTKFSLFAYDEDDTLLNTDGSTLSENGGLTGAVVGGMSQMMMLSPGTKSVSTRSSRLSGMGRKASAEELLPTADGTGISAVIKNSYAVEGKWPESYDEVVLVADKNHEISAATLCQLGLLKAADYRDWIKKIDAGEELDIPQTRFSYDELYKKEFYLLPACDEYEKGEDGLWHDRAADEIALKEQLESKGLTLKVVGIIYPTGDTTFVSAPIAYSSALTDRLLAYAGESEIIADQKNSPEKSVLSGLTFEPEDDAQKIEDTVNYLSSLGISEKAKFFSQLMSFAETDPQRSAAFAAMDETQKAGMLDAYLKNPKDEELLKIYDAYISPGSYEDNLAAFGLVSRDAPASISIYADSFENKDFIGECIDRYNESASEEDRINYTDYVGLLMSSVTTIINVISYVLIAFVAVSLVVSSIMIGIITYISVLERTKEIGILRAIGASKRNISQVFNAETFMIGLLAGLFGVGLTLLLILPINAIIHSLSGITTINASLPAGAAVILVLLSMFLTILGGLIPSRKAAKKDPVTALRTE